MTQTRLRIIFQKLPRTAAEEARIEEYSSESEKMRAEIEKISELRRLVLQTTEPEPKSYTTT